MMDIGMYGNDHYQVGEMASSAYNYYPNYHNHSHSHSHSHLHHHHIPAHHHHHNPAAEILSAGFSPQNHTSNQTPSVLNASNHSLGMYHEYGITMTNSEHSFYDTDSNMVQSYYQNQSNPSNPHGLAATTSTSSAAAAAVAAASAESNHQVTPTSTTASSSSNDMLSESIPPSHIISSDNGLSYTNLDYMYGNGAGHPNPLYLHQTDDKSAMAHAYNHTTQAGNIENNLHSPVHSAAWQSQHTPPQHSTHSHHTSAYQLDGAVNAHSVSANQATVAAACLQNQATQLGTNPNGIHLRTLNNRSDPINTQQNSQSQSQHGQTVQTYKWMQVKRNVPKPQGIVSAFFL